MDILYFVYSFIPQWIFGLFPLIGYHEQCCDEYLYEDFIVDICLHSGGVPRHEIADFPDSSVGKESACNVGDLGLIPGLGRSPGEAKGYPLLYSGLENSMDTKSNFHFSLSNINTHAVDRNFLIFLGFNLILSPKVLVRAMVRA